jgi:hypothetical protein
VAEMGHGIPSRKLNEAKEKSFFSISVKLSNQVFKLRMFLLDSEAQDS